MHMLPVFELLCNITPTHTHPPSLILSQRDSTGGSFFNIPKVPKQSAQIYSTFNADGVDPSPHALRVIALPHLKKAI